MTEPISTVQQPTPPPPPAQPVAQGVTDSRRKSPFLACVLSLIPGLGQIYVGYYQRGFFNALIFALLVTLLTASESTMGGSDLIPAVGLFMGFFFLYNIVDAGRRASLYNLALAGGTEIEMPDDFRVPGFRGTIAGGAIMALVGVVLLLHTRFGMSLAWVGEWWPAAFILFGAYLIWKAKQEKESGELAD